MPWSAITGGLILIAILVALTIAPWLIIPLILFGAYQSRAKPTIPRFESKLQRTIDKPFIHITPSDKQAYLKSPEWQTLRKAVLKRDQYTCQSCKTTGIPLDVHHLHYRSFGNESTADLVSLCRSCHGSVHNKHGYDHNNTFPI